MLNSILPDSVAVLEFIPGSDKMTRFDVLPAGLGESRMAWRHSTEREILDSDVRKVGRCQCVGTGRSGYP
jgi:hypothetical protein